MSRRCLDAFCGLLEVLLPPDHHFPPNIWSTLSVNRPEMEHKEVAYCGQGMVPSGPSTRPLLCPDPTVYYGDDHSRPNCKSCGSTVRKVMYLIPIAEHIRVPYTHNIRSPPATPPSLVLASAVLTVPIPLCPCIGSLNCECRTCGVGETYVRTLNDRLVVTTLTPPPIRCRPMWSTRRSSESRAVGLSVARGIVT